MSKALKIIGTIAGAVAIVATGVGLVGGAAFAATATGATVATIANIASAVAIGAGIGASILQKPPPAKGSVTQVLIAPDAPQPYVMGEGYYAGVLRHDAAYGATLNKVPNPYRGMVVVYSGGGPVQSITPYVDKAAVSSWYSTYLYTSTQLGTCPTATAMAPYFSGFPGWGADSKLSGQAAILWNLKFDKDGKRFASGVPQLGAYGQWVKVYDPRLDDTFPGGSGACRLGNESTYVWSENPALHAGTYAYGRYQNGLRTIGVGLPSDGIDWVVLADLANVCDANGWTLYGVIYEPGDRWANLKEICIAGGAEPVIANGQLSFKYSAPKIALDTITEADLADESASVTAMQSWRDLVNTIVPKYLSPAHEWQLVQAEAVQVSSYVTEDGEVKQLEWPFNLVKQVDQATQLAAYRLVDARELQPIQISCNPRVRAYRPGECLHLDIPSLGLDTPAIILKRQFDPAKMVVNLTLMGETDAKHDYALGLTGVAPPTPALGQTAEDRDQLSAAAANPTALDALLIANSWVTDIDPADGLLQATDTQITIESHTRTYTDKTLSIAGATLTTEDDGITGISAETLYHIYYDDELRSDTTPDFKATLDSAVASNSPDNPARHYVGSITTDIVGGSGTTGGGSIPPGWNGDDWYNLP